MAYVALKCPSCGADIQIDDSREFGFCSCCGTKIVQDKTVIEHAGSIRVEGTVNIVDSRYKALLVNANKNAELYFEAPNSVCSNGKYGYEAVLESYSQAELAGGVSDSCYWESISDFYFKAQIDLASKTTNRKYDPDSVLAKYKYYIDNAIEFADTSEDKSRLHSKKEHCLAELDEAITANQLKLYKEKLNEAIYRSNLYMGGIEGSSAYSGLSFDDVKIYYIAAKRAGGGKRSDYWEAVADFYARVNSQQGVIMNDYEKICTQYDMYIDNAIKYSSSEEETIRLSNKRNEMHETWERIRESNGANNKKLGIKIAIGILGAFIVLIILALISSHK